MPKPTFTIERTAGEIRLRVQGDLNVQHAREMKPSFQQLSEENGMDIHLDFLQATAFDLSAIQLSYLLRTEVHRQGRQLKVTLPQDAALCDLLEKCGITKIIQ